MWCVIQDAKYDSVSFSGALFIPSFVKVSRFLQTWRSHRPVCLCFSDLGRKIRPNSFIPLGSSSTFFRWTSHAATDRRTDTLQEVSCDTGEEL